MFGCVRLPVESERGEKYTNNMSWTQNGEKKSSLCPGLSVNGQVCTFGTAKDDDEDMREERWKPFVPSNAIVHRTMK